MGETGQFMPNPEQSEVKSGFEHRVISSESPYDDLPRNFAGTVLDHINSIMIEREYPSSYIKLPRPVRNSVHEEAVARSRPKIIS